MCHVLEHVGHSQSLSTLREMHRILRPGGVLRISVPDFDLLVEAYQASGRQIPAIERALMGGQDYQFNFHYSAFNAERLRTLLLKGGFRATRPWNPLACTHHDFEDWASRPISWKGQEFPVSLNLEGVK
jgi:SAM-dependent methyltransferase